MYHVPTNVYNYKCQFTHIHVFQPAKMQSSFAKKMAMCTNDDDSDDGECESDSSTDDDEKTQSGFPASYAPKQATMFN